MHHRQTHTDNTSRALRDEKLTRFSKGSHLQLWWSTLWAKLYWLDFVVSTSVLPNGSYTTFAGIRQGDKTVKWGVCCLPVCELDPIWNAGRAELKRFLETYTRPRVFKHPAEFCWDQTGWENSEMGSVLFTCLWTWSNLDNRRRRTQMFLSELYQVWGLPPPPRQRNGQGDGPVLTVTLVECLCSSWIKHPQRHSS